VEASVVLRKLLARVFAKRVPIPLHDSAPPVVLDKEGWQARRQALVARFRKARWDDTDPAIRKTRLEWVNQEILAVIAHTDPDTSVRLNACRWIMEKDVLDDVAARDELPEVRDMARRYAAKLARMEPEELKRMRERLETRRRRLRESDVR
jgi:hypothetical protein